MKLKTVALAATLLASVQANAYWKITEKKDSFTDAVSTVATETKAALVCASSKKVLLNVVFDGYLFNGEDTNALWRVGEKQGFITMWAKDRIGGVYYLDDYPELLQAMKAGNDARFLMYSYDDDKYVTKVNLMGFTKAYNAVASTCK